VEQYLGPFILVLPLLLLWMLFTRTRRQQRLMAAVQDSVRAGLWVMTTSGLYGQVISAGDEPTVLLEIAPGVHTRWVRQAIAEVFEEDPNATALSSVVDLTTDDAHGTSVSPYSTDEDDSQPDDRDDRTHN